MMEEPLPKALGLNHVALEVRDIDEELAFLQKFLDFSLRSKGEDMAFIELADQFIALMQTSETHSDQHRHFGLVVDDKERLKALLKENDIEILGDRFLNFRDPSGNQWQVVNYSEVEYLKDSTALQYLGCTAIGKTEEALSDLLRKGIKP